MRQIRNFGAGPAVLPEEVLLTAQREFLDWHGLGMSITEVSHRSKEFEQVLVEAEQDLRDLLQVPDHYKVLFLTGPARAQFAMVPMNLLRGKPTADYLETGIWSEMAASEAAKYCRVSIVASSKAQNFLTVPAEAQWQLNHDAAYFYYVANETLAGLEFHKIPEVGNVPLVSDMTSNLLSRPIDVSKFALIFAGAQKNIAPAGLTLVIVREDMLGNSLAITPSIYDYKNNATEKSLLYTPATFSYYMAGLTFKWIKQQGGLEAMARRNQAKAAKLYHFIDHSGFYHNPIPTNYRSWMNVTFTLANKELDESFLKQAKQHNLVALKGHRFVGGMRASIYNAMDEAGVDELIAFMTEFEKTRA